MKATINVRINKIIGIIALVQLATLNCLAGATEYKVVPVTEGGIVEGTISFKGKAPKSKSKTINKDQKICGEGKVEYDVVEIGASGELSEVVVYLENITEGKTWKGNEEYKLDQKACRFQPSSYVVKKGANIHLHNSDGVFHNSHAYEMAGRARISMFNVGQIKNSKSTKKLKTKRKNSHAIKIECDAHNFMHAWMFAADNPYYSVTKSDGKFTIEDIPPGKYKLSAWHPVLGTQSTDIEIKKGGSISQNITLK